MGIKNYLIEGVSGTGKTSVCHTLRRRGYHAINGDRELAVRGDPGTGKAVSTIPYGTGAETAAWAHAHHIWDIDRLKAMIADRGHEISFFCGGSRNFSSFIHLFDGVFVLDIDRQTLSRRLSERPEDEFGGKPDERELIMRLHATREDIPQDGIIIDAAAPLERVVDDILRKCAIGA